MREKYKIKRHFSDRLCEKQKTKKSNCLELTVCFLISFASSFLTNRSGCRVRPDQKYIRLFPPILEKYSSLADVVGGRGGNLAHSVRTGS